MSDHAYRAAVTLCMVSEAARGPFVFHGSVDDGFAWAAKMGFDAVELFPPDPSFATAKQLRALSEKHQMLIAAIGTGAGMVRHGLSLTDPAEAQRTKAREFMEGLIRLAGEVGAPAILGSMQGRAGSDRAAACAHLGEALRAAGALANECGQVFLYEPLNRYETDLFNTLEPAAAFLTSEHAEHVQLLADLFHMNIEEARIEETLRLVAGRVGHIHFADSNRRAPGFGHTAMRPIIDSLRDTGYAGFLSAEIFPLPDRDQAARQFLAAVHATRHSPTSHAPN